eukprot:superscaffoldBa00004383_g18792
MYGAQATVINEAWRAEHLRHTILRSIEELLGPEPLTGLAANRTEIPFNGWVEEEFKLYNREKETEALTVPILQGFNVIEEMVKTQNPESRVDLETIHTVSTAFSVTARIAKMVVKLMQTPDRNENVDVLRNGRKRVILGANEVTAIRVPAHLGAKYEGQKVLFTVSDLHPLPEGVTEGL